MTKGKIVRVALSTLGCKVNQCESASFQSGFEDEEAKIVPFSHEADIYVINTCAVTGKAASQSRQMIRRALRANPLARIVVTGCYSQVESNKVLDLSDRAICIVGNGMKDHLVDIALSNDGRDLEMFLGDIGRKKEYCHLPVNRFSGRTRAFLKIQDGCNSFCSYCIVPYARGRSRSLRPEDIFPQVDVLVRQGAREIVLTGIHLGIYGKDLSPAESLFSLIRDISEEYPEVRFRLSSLEPSEITDDLLQLVKDKPSLMPHFHIPLQSGDESVLRRMNRKYGVKDFVRIVENVVKYIPHAAIGVDVMVGFPGESAESFRNTKGLLESQPVSYLHVFPYSKRPGTVASGMKGQLPNGVKEERAALLRELDHMKRTAFYGKHIGRELPVLAESSNNRFKLMKGFTDNYIPVYFEAPGNISNSIAIVRLDRLMDTKVFGRRIHKEEGNGKGEDET